METEQCVVELRPMGQARHGSIFSNCLVIGQPNLTGELVICSEYQELILQEILINFNGEESVT